MDQNSKRALINLSLILAVIVSLAISFMAGRWTAPVPRADLIWYP